MKHAADIFSNDDHQKITQAVIAAEAKTSAEIVPVVANASGRYDRPEDIVGLWVGVVTMGLVWALKPVPIIEAGSWGGMPVGVHLLLLIVALIAGFVVGVALAMRVNWLRALFTPRAQMAEDVLLRARSVFFDRRVHHTSGSTGLLVYVSLFEHQAAVIADQIVLDKLGQGTLDELCRQLTQALRTQSPTDAICQVIAAAGEKLGEVLPREHDDVNELADALVVLE